MKPLHHKTVNAIIKAVKEGKSYTSIHRQYNVSMGTIAKYKKIHSKECKPEIGGNINNFILVTILSLLFFCSGLLVGIYL